MLDFKFENLGPIDTANIQLNRLTLLCGPNNSGKTYLTNTIYAYLKHWTFSLGWKISNEAIAKLEQYGSCEIDLEEELFSNWDDRCKAGANRFVAQVLPVSLATSADRLEQTYIETKIPIKEKWYENSLNLSIRKGTIHITKLANSYKITISSTSNISELSKIFLRSFIRVNVLNSLFNDEVFICSAERTGAIAFKNHINFYQENLRDAVESLENHELAAEMSAFKRDYAEAISDNLKFLMQLGISEKTPVNNRLITHYPELIEYFKEITLGSYRVDTNNQMYYTPNQSSNELKIGETSTSVRSLGMIWYWLQFIAKKNNILIVDEPEINLHPRNQRLFARFITRLVNCGVQVFITTHSDYIIREINTLILMSHTADHIPDIKKKYGYAESDKLIPYDVNVYVTKGNNNDSLSSKYSVVKIPVDSVTGVQIESFDNEINNLNKIQHSMLYGN